MKYDGGKNGAGTFQRIINQIPPHRVYVELFAGSAAVLRKKRAAEESWAVEIDAAAIAALGEAAGELPPNTRLLHADALELLETVSMGEGWFIYADPPYMAETRRGGRVYRFELTAADHRRLLELLKKTRAMAMVSGYWSALYGQELRDWRTEHFRVMTRQGPATEWLWMNYPEPAELHDYRYLGNNFRDREKFRRQQRRWAAKLAGMDRLRRLALMAAIDDRSIIAVSGDCARVRPAAALAALGEQGPARAPSPAPAMVATTPATRVRS